MHVQSRLCSPSYRSRNSVFGKHYWCMTPNQKQARSHTVLLGRAFLSSGIGNPLPQFPHRDCTAVWTLVLGSTELGGTGACTRPTRLLAAEVAEGGGHALAGHRTPRPRGVLKAQPQGHRRAAVTLCSTEQDLLFAEGSQQMQPPPALCLLRAEAVLWRAQLMWELCQQLLLRGGL